jgi:hypothetical protein
MSALEKLRKQFKKATQKESELWLEEVPAWMGDKDGQVTTGIAGMVYVRTVEGQLLEVFNNTAPAEYNLLIKIGRRKDQPDLWQVIGRREVWDVPGTSSVVHHHEQHEFMAPDMVMLDRRQISQLSVLVRDAAAFTVQVIGAFVHTANGIAEISSQVVDLSGELGSDNAVFVNIECDDDGVISLHKGADFGSPYVATVSNIPAPDPGKYMIATVLLYQGQETLLNEYIRVPMPLGFNPGGYLTGVDWGEIGGTLSDQADLQSELDAKSDTGHTHSYLTDAPSNGKQYARQDGAWAEVDTARGNSLVYHVDGTLAVAGDVGPHWVATVDLTLSGVYIAGKDLGSAGITIVDVNIDGVTIFTDQDKRPQLTYNDSDGWIISDIPDVVSVSAGQVVTFDIDQVATGASGLTVGVIRATTAEGGDVDVQKYPSRAMMWHEEANILTGSEPFTRASYTYDTNQNYIYTALQDPDADGDSFTNSCMLEEGTYDLYILGAGELNNGKVDWYVDDVLIASGQDWYDTGPTYNVTKVVSGVSVVGSGRHVLKGVINGKNGSSIGYFLPLNKYWFEPSADTAEI